jgi:hypothetical protein
MIISRSARLVERVACMEEMGIAYKVLPQNLKRKGHLGILGVDGKMGARGSVVG